MSVQTTPSLKKLSEASPPAAVPAQPAFTSPPPKETEKGEEKSKAEINSITNITDTKLDGEIFIGVPWGLIIITIP